MEDFVFLSVTNKPYVPIVENLIRSLNDFHPNILLYLVCVNMDDNDIENVKNQHQNIRIITVNKEFKKFGGDRIKGPLDTDHEEGYCTSCRSWFMLDIMKKENKSVFYLDADVFLRGPITGLFPELQKADFMIRAKNLVRETFKCNAGMVWVKNTEKNQKLVSKWAEKTINMGISWRSNQWTLDEIIRENWDDIEYKDFPLLYNGKTNNPDSILVHLKGPKR